MHLRPGFLARLIGVGVVASLPVFAFACGPTVPAQGPAGGGSASAAASTSAPKVGFGVAEDRTPYEAPVGLVAEAHVSSPRAIARTLKGYFAGTAKTAEKIEAREMLGKMIGAPSLAQLVDIDKPVDAAVVLRGATMPKPKRPSEKDDPLVAFAFSVEDDLDATSITAKLKANFRLEPQPTGVVKLVPTRARKYDDLELGQYDHDCVLAPSVGASRYRLVCTLDRELATDLDVMAPWLARGVTRRDPTAGALRIDAHLGPVKAQFQTLIDSSRDVAKAGIGGMIRFDHPELSTVFRRLAAQVVDEAFDLLADTDTIGVDVGFAPDGVHAAMEVGFTGGASWISRAFQAEADVTTGAPAGFAKLPIAGGFAAAFSRASSGSDALLQPWAKAALDLAEATATDYSWSKPDRALLVDVARMLFPKPADTIVIEGLDVRALGAAKAPKVADPAGDALTNVFAKQLERPTWVLSEVDRDAKPSVDLWRQFTALLARPAALKLMRELTDDRASFTVKTTSIDAKILPAGAFGTSTSVAVFAESGATATKVDGKPKAPATKAQKTPALSVTWQAIVAPDGPGKSWNAWSQSGSAADLATRLKAAMAGTSDPALGARQGLDILLKGTPAFGMYLPIDGLLLYAAAEKMTAPTTIALPDGGRAGVAFVTGATRKGSTTAAAMGLFLPRDLFALGAALGEDPERLLGRMME